MHIDFIRQAPRMIGAFWNWKPKPWPRPAQLLFTVVLTLVVGLFIDGITGWQVCERLFYPIQKTPADVQAWSALIYALALVGGLPVAFHVWYWRDVNKRHEIENTRKDINLKEFQEVQLRASGAFPSDYSSAARHSLQIAALHQLRSFLKGDYGESFKLPAFELYCALLAAPVDDGTMQSNDSQIALPVALALQKIVAEEWKAVFRSGFPLQHRSFNGIEFKSEIDLRSLDLTGSSFRLARFWGISLANARLNQCDFHAAKFDICDFKDAQLFQARFDQAKMAYCRFDGASLLEVDPTKMQYLLSCCHDSNTRFGRKDGMQLSKNDLTDEEAKGRWISKGSGFNEGGLEQLWKTYGFDDHNEKLIAAM